MMLMMMTTMHDFDLWNVVTCELIYTSTLIKTALDHKRWRPTIFMQEKCIRSKMLDDTCIYL